MLCRDTGAHDKIIALLSPLPFPTISIQSPSPEALEPFVMLTGTISKIEIEEKKNINHFLRFIIVDYGLIGEGRENIEST